MERLSNCPNCGGILDDFGKCQFCGSKVYDLCDIDVRTKSGKCGSATYIKKDKTYIRIRTDNQIILAPIRTNTVSISCSPWEFPTMNVEFVICGETKIQEVQNEQE